MLPVGCRSSFPVANKHSLTIGRIRWCLAVVMCTLTCRTTPSALLGIVSTTRPSGHWPRGLLLSTTNTKSPTCNCSCCLVRFLRSVKCGTYSCSHRLQICCTISWLRVKCELETSTSCSSTLFKGKYGSTCANKNDSELMAPDLRYLHLDVWVAVSLAMLKLQPQLQIALYQL